MKHRQLGQRKETKKGAGIAHQRNTQATCVSNQGKPSFGKKLVVYLKELESEKY